MYQQTLDDLKNINNDQIKRIADNAFIPFNLDNTDYQQFKKDLADGASLKDAEGNDMTAEQITSFLRTLA